MPSTPQRPENAAEQGLQPQALQRVASAGLASFDAPVAPVEKPVDALLEGLAGEDRERVLRAHAFAQETYAGRLLGTGEAAMAHALGLARDLAALRLDAETRAAGLLFNIPDCIEASGAVLELRFGKPVADLVAGIARLNSMRVVTRNLDSQGLSAEGRRAQAEVLRKMLLAMVGDIRVVLLRLASRAQSLRFLAAAHEAVQARAHARRVTITIRSACNAREDLALTRGCRGAFASLASAGC